MRYLKTGVANVVDIGPAVIGSTNGQLVTPVTTLANGTVDEVGVYKHGATALTSTTASAITHRAGGIYTLSLSTAHVNTVGRLTFYLRDDSACLPIRHEFMVLPAVVYDSLVAGTDNLQVDATQWAGQATASNDVALATSPTNFAALAITTAGVVTANTTLIEGADATDQINAAADAAIETYGLHQLVSQASTGNPVTNSYLGRTLNKSTAGTYNRTTDSLEAIRDRGDVAWTGGSTATFPANFASMVISTAGHASVDVVKLRGSSQSAIDLKDFADDGYNPATNKVQGVVLVDTVTTNTDMRGTDSAFLAASAPTNFGALAITTAGRVTVGTNADKTGYSLTQSFPTNFASLAITAGGAVTAGTVSDKTGYALSSTGLDQITLSEPGAVPTWGTVTVKQGIAWNVAFNRNKVISNSTEVTLRNDADTADIAAAAITATTSSVTRGEFA